MTQCFPAKFVSRIHIYYCLKEHISTHIMLRQNVLFPSYASSIEVTYAAINFIKKLSTFVSLTIKDQTAALLMHYIDLFIWI